MKNNGTDWIDNIKIFACILVAVGHFFQSMVISGVIHWSELYDWFIQTIYYFHVPLFFICSGFLYQKYSKVNTFAKWKANVKKKLIVLGIPYFTFSIITWGLKSIFFDSVNAEVNNLFYDLFIHPLSPYWYLYALFFIFLLIPTFTQKNWYIICFLVAILLDLFVQTELYGLAIILKNIVWFMVGIGICLFACDKKMRLYPKYIGIILIVIFLVGSTATWYFALESTAVGLILGMLACLGIIITFIQRSTKRMFLSYYTMTIYLMHTIFSAGVRSVLLKLGVDSAMVHILFGLTASFLGPILTAEVMRKTKLEFFLNPGKYIRIT